MTDAQKREKVIRGLECCLKFFNQEGCPEECPYRSDGRCYETIKRDALALLREQEARVMKPEEIPDYDGAIYLEDFGEPEIVIAVYDRGVARRVKFAIRGTRSTIAGYDDYNKRWRAWTSRPTEKQRENTPWEVADNGTV